MNLFLAVIDDLYQFAVDALMHLVRREEPRTLQLLPAHVSTGTDATTPSKEVHVPKKDEKMNVEENEPPQSFKTVEDILKVKEVSPASLMENTVMYVKGDRVPIFQKPTKEFDTLVGRAHFGDMVMVFEHSGRYARVALNGVEGWVLRDELADRAAYVYPEFIIGSPNGVDDPNTVRVRAILKDEFGGSIVEFPLQAGEYVAYRLLRKGVHIPWKGERPRVPGTWHSLLRGRAGVHIGISPKTGSIMEFMMTEDIGHLAYVEAVFPDETVTISEANYPDSGIYNERILTRDEWKELRPVFIQVT